MNINISAMDTERFGVNSARAKDMQGLDIVEAINFCDKNQVKFLIARCNAVEIGLVQEMERNGFLLCDTQVGYIHNLDKIPVNNDDRICDAAEGDQFAIKSIAAIGFKGYHGHYHNDSRIKTETADAIYEDWGWNICQRKDMANKVYLAKIDDKIVGFMAIRLNSPDEAEGVLSAILPDYQGKGIYRSFIIKALNYADEIGAKRFVMSTQILSIAVQKVWVRLGFEPWLEGSFYTFHKWF